MKRKKVLDICDDCGKKIYVGELVFLTIGTRKKRCYDCEGKQKG